MKENEVSLGVGVGGDHIINETLQSPQFQIIRRFSFSKYIICTTYLDIVYI